MKTIIRMAVLPLAAGTAALLAGCGATQAGGKPHTAAPASSPPTMTQLACQSGLDAARQVNAALASHDAATVASAAQTQSRVLTGIANAGYQNKVAGAVVQAIGAEAGSIDAIGQIAQGIPYGEPWSDFGQYTPQLAQNVTELRTVCPAS